MIRMSLITAWAATVGGVAVADEAAAGSAAADDMHPRVKMETSLGNIVLELDAEKAPITVVNFLRYAEDKFYDGTVFHRVMNTFMIQGGGFTTDMDKKTDGLRSPIKLEAQNGLSNTRGTIAMARTNLPDSATSQFFINVVDNKRLDTGGGGYAVFGKVVEGMDTVDKIRDTEVGTHPKYGGGRQPVVPVEAVVIKSVRLVSPFDRTRAENRVKELEEAARIAKAAEQANREKALKDVIAKLEKEHGGKFTTTDSGLMMLDIKVGEGKSPAPTDTVEVHYRGTFPDGKEFDSSYKRGTPATFALNRVIKGWTEGVGSMKAGGKRALICPPDLAYGSAGRPGIPPNSTLVFEVELISIK
ncbi:MAG: peptidylprolyl isomerase [Phycisphaerae bacterium]